MENTSNNSESLSDKRLTNSNYSTIMTIQFFPLARFKDVSIKTFPQDTIMIRRKKKYSKRTPQILFKLPKITKKLLKVSYFSFVEFLKLPACSNKPTSQTSLTSKFP